MKHNDWFEHISATSRITILAFACAGAFPPSTSAQTHAPEGFTKGFSLGGHVAVISVNPGSFDSNSQARLTVTGFGLTVAYGLNEWLTLTLTGDGHETVNDRHFAFADIGAQVFLPRGRRVRPHLDVALTGRRADLYAARTEIDMRGAGLSVGGGALYFLSHSFALDAALMWTPGDLDRYVDGKRVKDPYAVGVSGTRVLLGVRWFAGDRR